MRQLKAIFTLLRVPNIFFIFIIQVLLYHYIVLPYPKQYAEHFFLNSSGYYLLALSTTLIAAAGYAINDYFDTKIDVINKPARVTVEKLFKRRTVMALHITLNIIALGIAFYISNKIDHPRLIWIHLLSIFILIIYSASWKRIAFLGNLSIALLTVLCVLTPLFYTGMQLQVPIIENAYAWFYIFFAFMLTWIREIIKDLEDIKGDQMDGCRTMPIVYGIIFSKKMVYALISVALVGILYFFTSIDWHYRLYNMAFLIVIVPALIYLLYVLYPARVHKQYKMASRITKIITFAGILLLCLLRK